MTTVHPVINKKHLVTQIIVTFSGAVNAGEADSLATYRLATAGKKGSFTAKNAQVIKQRLLLKPAIVDALLDQQGLLAIAVKHAARAERALRDDAATNQRRAK